jgi:SAM-dependent methyltransferase
MSVQAPPPEAELFARQRAMWGLGDYPSIAQEVVSPLGPVLVAAAGLGPGVRVLDVGAGTGNVAIPAARAGADVVASDLQPDLLHAGRRRAEAEGVSLDWREANAEALPFEDQAFDAVVSAIGVMFAPHHQRSADELVRVCRTGGTLGLLSWTPEGFIGRLFATMRPFAPPPPPGASPPPLWGEEGHVRELLGDRVTDVATSRGALPVDRFGSGAEFRDYFKTRYGPTIAAYRGLGGDADREAELDEALAALGDDGLSDGRMSWEYLVVTARRA